jgi:hypothetical protein
MMVSPAPIAPGHSPFHVRGSTYVGVRDHIDRDVPGGFDAVRVFLPDQAHVAFASQVFLPVSMYDVLPLIPLTEAVAIAEKLPYAQSVRQRARVVAQRDISGLYKLFFKAVSPSTAAERLQKAAVRYFDFGGVHILEKSPYRTLLEHKGLPRPLLPWYLPMIEGYTSVVLEMAGAKNSSARTDLPRKEGHRDGIEVVSIRIELSWS